MNILKVVLLIVIGFAGLAGVVKLIQKYTVETD